MPDRRNMKFRQKHRFLLFIKAFIALYVLYTDKFNDFIFFLYFDGFLENADAFISAW